MKPEELAEALKLNNLIREAGKRSYHIESYDTEMVHYVADELLLETLEELGYGEAVRNFRKLDKWYA